HPRCWGVTSTQSDSKEIGKSESPVIHVFGRIQKSLNELVPLVRILARQEFAHSSRRRQGPGHIQTDSPEKFCVARDLRGNNFESAQLGENMLVYQIPLHDTGIVPDGVRDH